MNGKKVILGLVLAAFMLSTIAFPGLARPQKETKEQTQPTEKERIFIPKDVKAVLEEGLASRQGVSGIPVSVVDFIYLPYYRVHDLMHNIFGLSMKNADLDFAPAGAPAAPTGEKPKAEAEEKKETTSAFEEVPAGDMESRFDLFLQFRQIENNVPGQIVKEVYVPTDILIPATEYKPEEESVYYVGYDLAPGQYLLALAVRSMDQKKMGTAYYEFSTPNPDKLEGQIETTPIILTKDVSQMQGQETRTILHRGYFTYLVLKVTPNLDHLVPEKSRLGIFYFILGAQANDQGKFSLETNFEVKQNDKEVIKYAPTVYEAPYVSLDLPLKQTLKKEGTEETHQQDLGPGKYTLVITITDKLSGAKVTKNLDFEVVQRGA